MIDLVILFFLEFTEVINYKDLLTMELRYNRRLRCATCGQDSYFEPNHDESYIMCMYCCREYHGGYEELFQLNVQELHNRKAEVEPDIKMDAVKDLYKSTKMN